MTDFTSGNVNITFQEGECMSLVVKTKYHKFDAQDFRSDSLCDEDDERAVMTKWVDNLVEWIDAYRKNKKKKGMFFNLTKSGELVFQQQTVYLFNDEYKYSFVEFIVDKDDVESLMICLDYAVAHIRSYK
jgi:hypothetical protein